MELKYLSKRSAIEVFEDHLKLAKEGKLEEDLSNNYDANVVLLTNYGTFYGHKGTKEAAALLEKQLPDGGYKYILKLFYGKICFLQWTGNSEESYILDGADSFLIEKGKIKVQTIYYTFHKKIK